NNKNHIKSKKGGNIYTNLLNKYSPFVVYQG
ncbi:MAG: hypothetical protein ACI9OE_002301, partial [Mariniflexile sp.]